MAHLDLVAGRTDELGVLLYALLDERHPKLMDSLGPGSTQRTQMLNQILAAVHDSLYVEDAEWVSLQLKALGHPHVRWRVATPMYAQVTECLVDALATLPDTGWSPELNGIWRAELAWISKLMHGLFSGPPRP